MSSVSSEKWQHVPSKKGNRRGNPSDAAERHKTTGMSQSSTPFSKYGEQQRQMDEEEEFEGQATSEAGRGMATFPHSKTREQHQSSSTAKKASTVTNRKPKPKKLPLEECVAQLDMERITELVEDLQRSSDHLSGVKEIQSYLQSVLGRSEQEKDYTFSSKSPDYPLSLLPAAMASSLQEAMQDCPALAQEKAFVYCMDRLLADLGAGSSTWATRIMMQLLIRCNHSVCLEAGKMIKLNLQSNISRVPEALSLLWAGMPHPQVHLSTAIRTWPDLCLPLFQLQNIPKQVFSYALQYTTTLLMRLCEHEDKDLLLDLVHPKAMCQLLASHQLNSKKSLRSVQEFLTTIPDTVIESCSESRLVEYFKEIFKHLTCENNAFLLTFLVACLSTSRQAWEVWSVISSSPAECSSLLLHEIQAMGSFDFLPMPLEEWAGLMAKISHNVQSKDRPLIKSIVESNLRDLEDSKSQVHPTNEQSGVWCSGCGLLVVTITVLYAIALTYVLHRVSTEGPGVVFSRVTEVAGPQWVEKAWGVVAVALDRASSFIMR